MREVPAYAARVLSSLRNVRETSDGWDACCPCPTHGSDGSDSRPSFRVTAGDGGRLLLYCRAGCRFRDILIALGLTATDLLPDVLSDESALVSLVSASAEPSIDDSEFRHQVYSSLLTRLPLDPEHARDLERRGLPRAERALRGYCSCRASSLPSIEARMYEEFGDALLTVPGFISAERGGVRLKAEPGLVVPVLGPSRKILALKVRRFGDPKYVYVSSSPHGRSPGVPPHCPVPALGQDFVKVRVTEGELKADVATFLSGLYTVGLAGVGTWWRVFPTLEALGVREVVVSWDYRDVRLNVPVARQCLDFVKALLERGYKVSLEHWDVAEKGIDDALLVKQEIFVEDNPVAFLASLPSLSPAKEVPEWTPCPFPLEVFPASVRAFIVSVSSSMPCPPDFLAVPVLVGSGAATGGRVRLRCTHDWYESGNLYAVLVAPAGSLKTPALNKVMAPLVEENDKLREAAAAKLADYKKKLIVWKARHSAYVSSVRKYYQFHPEGFEPGPNDPKPPAEPPDPPAIPKQEYLWVDDTTMEALVSGLASSPWGVLYKKDEYMELLRSMNVYRGGMGGDRQKILSMWSREPVQVTRKGQKDDVCVKKPFLSILAGIQPDHLSDLEEEKGREDGFIHRILFSMPHVPRVPAFVRGTPPEAADVWGRIVRALRSEEPASADPPEPRTVVMTPAAETAFEAWHVRHLAESESPEFPSGFEGPWSKLKAYQLRLALILFLLRRACIRSGLESGDVPEELDADDVNNAARLTDYFKDHMRGVWGRLRFDLDDRRIDDFCRWVKGQGGKVALSEVRRKGQRWRLKSISEVRKFVAKACDRNLGFISREKGHTGRPREVFILGGQEE